jgi:glucose-1-phosphate adenylyltransferase
MIHTNLGSLPPAKFVFDEEGRRGTAIDSMVCSGSILSGGEVRRSVISSGVTLHHGALVEDSVLLSGIDVGPRAVIKRAIIDKNVIIPKDVKIGVDPEADRRRGFTISEGGIVVIGKDAKIPID